MLEAIQEFNKQHQLFFNKNRIVLAISGGIDSMVLLDLFSKMDVEIVVAHCNFQLRGEDSDRDEKFVHQICNKQKIEFVCKKFNTQKYSTENNLSIQESARSLRYQWFEELRLSKKASVIVTAHHLNDNFETLFFNLIKGTGIKGLRGMLPRNNHIIRPMLDISKEEIQEYTIVNNISYREDSSNKSLKYSRNLIRNKIVPEIKIINPNFVKTQIQHFKRFRDIDLFYKEALELFKSKLFEKRKNNIFVSINKLRKHKGFETLLYEMIHPFGFSNKEVSQIISSLDGETGKMFFSKTHRIIKDKKHLIITDISQNIIDYLEINDKKSKAVLPNNELIRIQSKPISKLTKKSKKSHYAYLDKEKIQFPMILRKWKEGDYFYPFGMYNEKGKAKKKKVKKYFNDLKLSIPEKENIWILTNGDKIVWVVNHRIDDRFKVTDKTKDVFQLKFVECKN